MRRLIAIAAGAALAALVCASVALAAFTQVSNIRLTAHRAGQSTGIVSDVHSSDPSAPGQKPKGAKLLVVTFPVGTRFNLGRVKPCTLSDAQLTAQFGPSCPGPSQIGTGSAVANAAPLITAVNAAVKAYAGGAHQLVLVAKATKPVPTTLVIRATASGSRLSIPIPQLNLGGIKVVLTSLKLSTPAIGSGPSALMTAGKCAAHKFVVKSHFAYVDGSTLDEISSSACS
jgi:hypothetical protein